jgi:hypothetical protein
MEKRRRAGKGDDLDSVQGSNRDDATLRGGDPPSYARCGYEIVRFDNGSVSEKAEEFIAN